MVQNLIDNVYGDYEPPKKKISGAAQTIADTIDDYILVILQVSAILIENLEFLKKEGIIVNYDINYNYKTGKIDLSLCPTKIVGNIDLKVSIDNN